MDVAVSESEDRKILYSERVSGTRLLGPGNRAVLWVHGCCFDCPGCIAYNFRFGSFFEENPDEMARWFLNTGADGLTISGGEPMLQAAALAEMITGIREKKDTNVIVYSGFVYEDLLKSSSKEVKWLLDETDILIDGMYLVQEDHNEPYRGSANQRILALTDRLKAEMDSYYYSDRGRQVEIKIEGRRVMMVGVPGKEHTELFHRITSDTGKGAE